MRTPFSVHRLAVGQALQRDVGAEPCAQHAFADRRGQVGAMARPRMVGMRMREHRTRHRPPRVDVEVARGAIQSLRAQHDEVVVVARVLQRVGGHAGQCVA